MQRQSYLHRTPRVVMALVALWLLGLSVQPTAKAEGDSRQEAAGPIPAAADALAQRLGLHGPAFIGDQPEGAGRPWVIWFPGLSSRERCEYTGRQALFSGPKGVAGEFHFFDSSPLTRCGADAYRGPKLTRTRAIGIALAWLHHAHVAVPRAAMHVYLYSGTTIIGGTGLCCFHSVGLVYWGRGPTRSSFLPAPRNDVYVVDRGTVAQVDRGGPPVGESPSYPCSHTHQDRNGVLIGPRCFSYAAAADNVAFSQVGGHDGWRADPSQVVPGALSPVSAEAGPIHQIARSSTRATYRLTAKGTTYEVILVPSFPGLHGAPWEVIDVRARAEK